jgi:hypothetical protein
MAPAPIHTKKQPKAQGTLDSPFKKWKVEEWDDDNDNPTITIIEPAQALVNPNTSSHAIITSPTSTQLLPITSDQPHNHIAKFKQKWRW